MMPPDDLESIIAAVSKISAQRCLRDKIYEATQTERRVCGSCNLWMMSNSCPREARNSLGGREGPSRADIACNKFSLAKCLSDLKAERMAEAVSYAKAHGLPMPPVLERDQ